MSQRLTLATVPNFDTCVWVDCLVLIRARSDLFAEDALACQSRLADVSCRSTEVVCHRAATAV